MGLRSLLTRLFGGNRNAAPAPQTMTYAAGTGLVEITAPAPPGRPLSKAASEHHQFIVSNWMTLAAAAYAGFRRHGIGVVVIEAPADRESPQHAFTRHDLAYATGLGGWRQPPPPHPASQWLEGQLQTYEPLEAGLFLFRNQDTLHPPRPYHAIGTPTPPEAFEASRASFN